MKGRKKMRSDSPEIPLFALDFLLLFSPFHCQRLLHFPRLLESKSEPTHQSYIIHHLWNSIANQKVHCIKSDTMVMGKKLRIRMMWEGDQWIERERERDAHLGQNGNSSSSLLRKWKLMCCSFRSCFGPFIHWELREEDSDRNMSVSNDPWKSMLAQLSFFQLLSGFGRSWLIHKLVLVSSELVVTSCWMISRRDTPWMILFLLRWIRMTKE